MLRSREADLPVKGGNMYSLLILAPHDDQEELDLPQALDPQFCERLSSKRDSFVPLQQPLTFQLGPLSLHRDYLRIKNAPGNLCSERFIEIFENASVPFTAYPVLLLDRETEQSIPARYFFWLPKWVKSEEIIDQKRSEIWVDAETGFSQLATLALKPESEATAPLLFRTAGGCLIHDKLRTNLEAAGINGILFAPLDTVSSPYSGIKLEKVRQHLHAQPDDRETWSELSRLLIKLHRYEEALAALDHVLALNTQDADAWYKRGQLLYRLGRLPEALAALKQAIELDMQSWAWKEYSQVLRELGRTEEALASAQQLVASKDKAYLSWYELGQALLALGHAEEALHTFNRSLRAGGNVLVDVPKSKGDLLYQLGRYEEALEAYTFGLQGNRWARGLWAGKAKTLRALGREQEAEAAEQELRKLGARREAMLKRGPW
jgi:tetratricopeptide (TPR) repeat protein